MAAPTGFDDLWSRDRAVQNAAFTRFFAAAEQGVAWAYDVWDDVVERMGAKDNHDRAIAGQLLSRLARSDPELRCEVDLPRLMAVTFDPRFVTARHVLQSLWHVGAAGERHRALLLAALRERFAQAADEKNGTLVRYDIVVVLRMVFDASGDDAARALALELIDTEDDAKHQKKYRTVWR